MKIEGIYQRLSRDNGNSHSVALSHELDAMLNEIADDYGKLWEAKRKIFYKTQFFNSLYKEKASLFNNVSNISEILKAKEDGLFRTDKIKSKESVRIQKEVAANFFPDWMWGGLEFLCVDYYTYDVKAFIFHYVWTNGKGKAKKQIEFEIYIVNPETIKKIELFDAETAFDDVSSLTDHFLRMEDKSFKTRVYVNTEYKADQCGASYGHVVSAYLNNEIADGIGKWTKDYLDGKNPQDKG